MKSIITKVGRLKGEQINLVLEYKILLALVNLTI